MRTSNLMAVLAITSMAAIASLSATGCKKKDSPAPPAKAVAVEAPVAAATVPAAGPADADAMRSLAGRLGYEAANRPSGTAKVEEVWAVLAKHEVAVSDTKQYLGMTAAAAYCAGGRTADGLAIAVCEYPSPAAAVAGREAVMKRFPIGAGRQITVHGATTITTTAPEGQDLTATRTKVEQAVTTL